MDTAELPDEHRRALSQLLGAVDANGSNEFERVGKVVRQRGTADAATFRINPEILRRLGHLGLIRFDRSKAPRRIFAVEAIATEFTALVPPLGEPDG